MNGVCESFVELKLNGFHFFSQALHLVLAIHIVILQLLKNLYRRKWLPVQEVDVENNDERI